MNTTNLKFNRAVVNVDDLISVQAGEVVSAAHVSAIFNKKIDDNFFMKVGYGIGKLFGSGDKFKTSYEGGWVDRAIKNTSDAKSVCSEEALPFDLNHHGETAEMIARLEGIKASLKKSNKVTSCMEIKSIQQDVFSNMGLNEIYTLLEKENVNQAFEELITRNCKEDLINISKLKVRSLRKPSRHRNNDDSLYHARKKYEEGQLEYFKKIGNILTAGKPMGISYNVKHITNGNGGHASVLTARRWKNGKCQFKIRNSWGKGCSAYDRNKIEECNYGEGSYWVSDQKFYDMASDLDYIGN